MDTKTIKFVSNREWLTDKSPSKPTPIIKTIPEWYRKADRFTKDPETGKPIEADDGSGKLPTWKACPAVYDVMGSGYTYKTPCDIEFSVDDSGEIQGKVLDPRCENILLDREPLLQFPNPPGYHTKHFAWWADWAIELPEGYSALYTQPLNRFELPFLTVSGIIDNDKLHIPGTMPFFVLKGATGVLPAGTPYAQIFPFKREHWNSEVDSTLPLNEMIAKNEADIEKYRKPDGGIYQRDVWERRKYQ